MTAGQGNDFAPRDYGGPRHVRRWGCRGRRWRGGLLFDAQSDQPAPRRGAALSHERRVGEGPTQLRVQRGACDRQHVEAIFALDLVLGHDGKNAVETGKHNGRAVLDRGRQRSCARAALSASQAEGSRGFAMSPSLRRGGERKLQFIFLWAALT